MGIMGNSGIEHQKRNIYSEVTREMVNFTDFEQLHDYITCELNKNEY